MNFLNLLVNFLLGASWAFALFGASIFFLSFIHISFFYSFIGFFVGALPGLFFVLLIEYFILAQKKLDELKKQTKLLEELTKK